MPTGYYQNNKEKLSKEALEWFQNLLEKKRKMREYCREHYKNLCLNMKNKGWLSIDEIIIYD